MACSFLVFRSSFCSSSWFQLIIIIIIICAGVNVIAGEFCIINEKFDPSLKDETATDFQQLAARITQQVDINIFHILLKLLLARPALLVTSFLL